MGQGRAGGTGVLAAQGHICRLGRFRAESGTHGMEQLRGYPGPQPRDWPGIRGTRYRAQSLQVVSAPIGGGPPRTSSGREYGQYAQ